MKATNFPYERIVVIGTTSSGKSTLAQTIADRFGHEYVDLDALHWEPNWTEANPDVFRKRVEEAIQSRKWVIAGNYHSIRDVTWPQADTAIWLDYSLSRIFWQLTRRTFIRWWTHELLWGTNYERLSTHFKLWSDDSLYHWLFKTYWRRKREYPELLQLPKYQHLTLLRFKHPNETREWLASQPMIS